MRQKIPYLHDGVTATIPDKNILCVMEAETDRYTPDKRQEDLVRQALEFPVDTQKLRDLAKGKRTALLVTSDHTRAMPSRVTLPILLDELRAGNPDIDITILLGTGLHRPTTRDEMIRMFGRELVDREKITVHDCRLEGDMRFVCTLPSGAEFAVNRLALETDLLVCEGFIEPHFFAGFSGGRKSILPGISSRATVNYNHSAQAVGHPDARAGVLDTNPLHIDMVYAARKVEVDFILNVALNGKKEIIGAFAGDLEGAFAKGVDFVRSLCGKDRVAADIVITSNGGYPLDQNLYQLPKSIATAAQCAGEDGVIIAVSSLVDGTGGQEFERLMRSGSPGEILAKLEQIPPRETISEQWCVQIFSKIMRNHHIIVVTQHLDHQILREMNLGAASTVEEALEQAFGLKGGDARICLIPDGVSVIINDEKESVAK